MQLTITRPKQLIDMTRSYQLIADGKKIAAIKRGETLVIDLPESCQYLSAKIDWCSSIDYPVKDLTVNQLKVYNPYSESLLSALFGPVYAMLFKPKSYLAITPS
jgi:hypothetical protein